MAILSPLQWEDFEGWGESGVGVRARAGVTGQG